jgi:fibronectin type 3 domain-containing protein
MKSWMRGLIAAFACGILLAGCGGGSSSTPPPAVPTALSVQPGDAVTTVQWPAVTGATSYNLYWSDTSPVTKASATLIAKAVSPFEHTGLTNGKSYYYAVSAVGDGGESELSSTIGATPVAPVAAPPGTVNATPGDKTVTVDWSPVSEATSYNLYWSNTPGVTPGGTGVTQVAIPITSTSYVHTGLTNATSYHYVITAVNTGGESVVSAEASATPIPAAPGAPTNLTATSGDTQVQLAWTGTSDAASYNVYWSKTPGIVLGAAGVTKVPGLTTPSYVHTGLTNGDTYYYVVTAVETSGLVESTLSGEVSARPLPPPPPAPLGLTAIAPKDVVQVAVQWYDVTNYPSATAPIQVGYNLYRGLTPGVASYYKDASRATKFSNVTAPFIDAAVTSATTYYYVVTSFVPSLPDVESVPSGEASADVSSAGGSGGGGGGDTGFGNNLSVPVIFADAYGVTGLPITGTWPGAGPFTTVPTFDYNTGLRPLSTETLSAFPYYDSSTAVSLGGVTYYPQATASTWQAQWASNASGAQIDSNIDWGDALLSRTYTTNSIVRIEVALSDPAQAMTAYKMRLLSGTGVTELQGTDGTTETLAPFVFAINARLKIEKIATGGGSDTVIYDKAVYDTFGTSTEGSGSSGGGITTASPFTAELNVGGSLVYGYNFMISKLTGVPNKAGQYRITFSLDPNATVGTVTVPNHVKMISKSDAGATLAADGLSTSVVITVN